MARRNVVTCIVRRLLYRPLLAYAITRILEILPSKDKMHLRISLLPREATIEYDALSYTWGSQEPSHVVYINHMLIRITRNLHEALQCLRFPDQPRYVWIYALNASTRPMSRRSLPSFRRCWTYLTTPGACLSDLARKTPVLRPPWNM